MKDLIRRSDALAAFAESTSAMPEKQGRRRIEEIPAVDAVEVRHGRWIQKEDKDWAGGGKTLCSKCKYGYSWKMYFEPENFNFCPNCGAKMEVQDG